MEQQVVEHEIVKQLLGLMDKAGFETITPIAGTLAADSPEFIEATLINLKTLNAKYDKEEAIQQVKCLMTKYNIQLEQLLDRRGII